MSMEEIRIVVVGNGGNGKSATVNSILGRNAFESRPSTYSVTKKCQFVEENYKGKRLIIVDTPSLFKSDISEEESIREMAKVIGITFPGLHALIVVVKVGRFTEQERKSFDMVAKMFGPQIYKQTIILFTGVDNLEEDCVEFGEYVRNPTIPALKSLLQRYGNRTVGFNNRAVENVRIRQVDDLLAKIETIVAENQNFNPIYDTVASMIEEEKRKRAKVECLKSKEDLDLQREIRKDIEEGKYILKDLYDRLMTQYSERHNAPSNWSLQLQSVCNIL